VFECVLWLPHKVEHRTSCPSYIVIHTMTWVFKKCTTQLTVFETRLSGVIFHFSLQLNTSTNIINTYVAKYIYKLNILQVGVSLRKRYFLFWGHGVCLKRERPEKRWIRGKTNWVWSTFSRLSIIYLVRSNVLSTFRLDLDILSMYYIVRDIQLKSFIHCTGQNFPPLLNWACHAGTIRAAEET
jgi:hypothetical protein